MITLLILLMTILLIDGCRRREDDSDTETAEVTTETTGTSDKSDTSGTFEKSYGVFIGVDEYSFHIEDFDGYDLVIIDAQELREEQLRQLHASGHTVYSYLNVGSLEKSRDYYQDLKHLCLDRYDNWPDEYWVNVTDDLWAEVAGKILPAMIKEHDPDIDGLFLDNLDVYAHLQEEKKYESIAKNAYDSLAAILEAYRDQGLPVIVNGADEFVTRLIDENRQDLIRGVNQETVFTRIINYNRDWFGAAGKEQKKFYTAYLERCSGAGLDVFLVEYTKDEKLAKEIRDYCTENGYRFYISEHVNLNPSE